MPTAVDLLRVIASTPDLPGAACVDHRDLFDACTGKAAGRPGTYARAVRICAACPTLRECRAWVTSLAPRERPPGVTAGLIQRCR